MKFNLGDIIIHHRYDSRKEVVTETGTITDIYSDYTSKFGPYPELYEVTWDNGKTERGFLPHGLHKA